MEILLWILILVILWFGSRAIGYVKNNNIEQKCDQIKDKHHIIILFKRI